jgi:hypothetical protein
MAKSSTVQVSSKVDPGSSKTVANGKLTKQNSIKPSSSVTNNNEVEIRLRNPRKAYECEQLGEEQAFLDDFYYFLDGIDVNNKLSERCLSAIKLAEECLSTEFRMNLRSSVSTATVVNNKDDADHFLNKIFNSLSDSVKYKVY